MLITDPKKAQALDRQRRRPWLPMVPFDAQTFAQDIARQSFPSVRLPVSVFFCKNDTLACVCEGQARHHIFLHLLLNDRATPPQVFRHIITHELIHLVVRPETIDGRQVYHTAAFWEYEARLVPDASLSWGWITLNFYGCLRRDEENERMTVKRNWKQFMGRERCSWERGQKLASPASRSQPPMI